MKIKLFLFLCLSFLSALGWAQDITQEQTNDSIIIRQYNQKGIDYYKEGNLLMALDNYEKALGTCLKAYGRQSYRLSSLYYNVGLVYYTLKNYTTALVYFENAMNIQQSFYGEEYPEAESDYMMIGYIHHYNGNLKKATEFYNKAKDIYNKKYPEGHSYIDTILTYIKAVDEDIVKEALGEAVEHEQ